MRNTDKPLIGPIPVTNTKNRLQRHKKRSKLPSCVTCTTQGLTQIESVAA